MTDRSSRREVRNPVLQLDGALVLLALPTPIRRTLAGALKSIRRDALLRADQCWRRHKAPMAVYWKAVGVYAGHLSRVLTMRLPADQPPRYQLLPHRCPSDGGWRVWDNQATRVIMSDQDDREKLAFVVDALNMREAA